MVFLDLAENKQKKKLFPVLLFLNVVTLVLVSLLVSDATRRTGHPTMQREIADSVHYQHMAGVFTTC